MTHPLSRKDDTPDSYLRSFFKKYHALIAAVYFLER